MSYLRSFSNIAPFLGALRTNIASVCSATWTDSCCMLSLWEENLQYPPGTPILQIIPGQFINLGLDEGGGTEELVLQGDIKFRLCIMSILDHVQGDPTVITSTNSALGIYKIADTLISAIEMLDLCNENLDSYLVVPFRIKSVGKPQRDKDHPEYCYMDIIATAEINQNCS